MENYNKIIIVLLAILFISCKQEQAHKTKKSIELKLLNSEVHFIDVGNKLDYSDAEKNFAKNIITLQIKNNSLKKYFFTFNFDELTFNRLIDNKMSLQKQIEDNSWGYMCYYILDANNSDIKYENGFNHALDIKKFIEFQKYNSSMIDMRINKFNELHPNNKLFFYDLYIKNSFVLAPNEIKSIQFLLYLPIIKELNNPMYENFLLAKLDKTQKYKFKLLHFNDSLTVKKYLPDYQLNDLRENNVEIFHGKLESNTIPLVCIKNQ